MMAVPAPVLDESVLRQLEDDLQDRHTLVAFLRRYLLLLDHRVHRLDHALTTRDAAAWMDAVLSLKTASAMAGATALSEATASLQDQFSPPSGENLWPRPQEREQIIADLRCVAEATRNQLALFLGRLTA